MKNIFNLNQIVKGKTAGHFVIVGFRTDLGQEVYAQLKRINPANHTEVARGEISLPLTALEAA